jgi:hypothetical protein
MEKRHPWGFRRWQWHRGNRPWHWLPKVYKGVNGEWSNLLIWGWVGYEHIPGPVKIDRDVAEELVEYLGKKQTTGGRFPMVTWRAEADGVEHLLAALEEALG